MSEREFYLPSNRAYIRALKRSFKKLKFTESTEEKDNYFVSTSRNNCKYCVEFRNFKGVDFFNKILTTHKLKNCEHYPKSFIIRDEKSFKKQKLDGNYYYYCKPKYGAQCRNISVLQGKETVIDKGLDNYPYIIQQEIEPELEDGKKVDYRTFVLYVKQDNMIKVFYSPHHLKRICGDDYENRTEESFFSIGENTRQEVVENTSEQLEQCLKSAQKYILPKFTSENASDLEFFLTGFDLIKDRNGKFWIMEVNSDPNFFHYDCETKFHQKIFRDITESIVRHRDEGIFRLDYFSEL